ncbi:MAG: DUF502 domain-containing protein [Firmicutes bacterium]|nr:DUF502 domain-containing protein [Bacillota bacterium]
MTTTWPRRIRNYLITGILIWLPAVVTIYVLWFGYKTFDSLLGNAIAFFVGERIPGAGILASLLVIFTTGVIATNYFGKKLIIFGERLVTRIPLVRSIYMMVKQIVDAFLHGANVAFKRVALIEYPRKGIYSVGFITSEGNGEVQEKISEDVVSVFLPTTPNPTSGYLLFLPKEDVTILEMSVEEGLKLVVSGGIVTPEYKKLATTKDGGDDEDNG